jgi:amino acid adenylation domain-containing protein
MTFTARGALLQEIAVVLGISTLHLDGAVSFIANGGDSLGAIRLQSVLLRLGFRLSLHSILNKDPLSSLLERLSTTPPAAFLRETPTFKQSIDEVSADDNESLLSTRLPKAKLFAQDGRKKLQTTEPAWVPLTDMQAAFFQSSLRHRGRNIISYCERHHTANIPRLKNAWRTVINSEPIFRTRMDMLDNKAVAIEGDDLPFDWHEIPVRNTAELDLEVKRYIHNPCGFGSRFCVFIVSGVGGSEESVVVWQIHHALIDGYSCRLVRSKVQNCLAGLPLRAGPSFVRFAEELSTLQKSSAVAAQEYWKACRARFPSAASRLSLPEPSVVGYTSTHSELLTRPISSDRVSYYCRTTNITPGALYHGAWALVLAPYANARQVSFGTVLSGRSLPMEGILDTVGPTISTLPFFAAIDPSLTVEAYLAIIFDSLTELTTYQSSVPMDGFSRDFSTAINIQLEDIQLVDPSDPSRPLQPPTYRVASDIPLSIEVSGEVARLDYHINKFSRKAARRILDRFGLAVDLLQERGVQLEKCLQRMSCIEWLALSHAGNWQSPISRADCYNEDLVTRFIRTTLTNPTHTAVMKGLSSITYWDLHVRSGIVAQSLSRVVSSGDVVCVHADRSINWIIAVYAVLKAGAVYCPIDSSLPIVARNKIFESSGADFFLTGAVWDDGRCPTSCPRLLSVEKMLLGTHATKLEAEHYRIPRARPQAAAYLCFTSGSSGTPKGVLCHHAGLVAFQSAIEVRLGAAVGQKISQIMSPGFDGSIHEIFSALGYGATLILPEASDPMEHLKTATVALMTPSLAKALEPASFMNLKSVYLVGESVSQDVCDMWAPGRQLYNMYGPTEATCGATIKRLQASQSVTLGMPNPSSRIYILNDEMQLVPFGVIGEICLAGVQVAVGYIGQPEAATAKFVPDLILPKYGERMYRTGDRGYWNENNELVFLGRRDRQIKLRGFRIDLDDLEGQIQRAAGCKDVAIALRDDHLVAQIQPSDFDMTALRSALRAQIPAYAMPRHFEAVDSFPLTPIGKTDYRAISSNLKALITSDLIQSHSHSVEDLVLDAVKEVLGPVRNESVHLQSTLLDLGATSVLLLTLSHRLSRLLNRRVPVRLLFEHPTLVDLVSALQHSHIPKIASSIPLGSFAVSPIEREWWEKYDCKGGSSAFNVNFACAIGSATDRGKLVSAWNTVLARHLLLRCRYRFSQRHGVCRTYSRLPPVVLELDDFDTPTEIDKCFNLRSDDLIRVLVSPASMLVLVSHIICDLTVLRILLQEAATIYNGQDIASISKPYDQTHWHTTAPQSSLNFWTNYLPDVTATARRAQPPSARRSWAGTSYTREVPVSIHKAMRNFGVDRRITMHQICLGAVALALEDGKSSCDITLGAPYLNRNSEDDQQIVGLFLEPLPVRICYPYQTSPGASFIDTVRASSQAAIANAVPWNLLLSHLGVDNDFPSHALFDTMVSFHDAQAAPQPLVEGLTHVPTWASGAKFSLMIEFTAEGNGDLWMRIEYSTECYRLEDAERLSDLLFTTLMRVVAE